MNQFSCRSLHYSLTPSQQIVPWHHQVIHSLYRQQKLSTVLAGFYRDLQFFSLILPIALLAQTASAIDFKSGFLSSRACVFSHLGEEPYFQWTDLSLVGRMHPAMNQD